MAQKQDTSQNGVIPYFSNDANGVFSVYFVNKNANEVVVEWKLLCTYKTAQLNPRIDASKIIETTVKGNATSSIVKVIICLLNL